MTLVHFATHALDLLGVWDDTILLRELGLSKTSLIEWIYRRLLVGEGVVEGAVVIAEESSSSSSSSSSSTLVIQDDHPTTQPNSTIGFVGGSFLTGCERTEYSQGHIAMTYTALCTLKTLGDDLQRVPNKEIIHSLRALQREDGSFACVLAPSEHDMRFLYCACAISYMLHDWSGINIDKAVEYIASCRSFDGAIALIPGQVGTEESGTKRNETKRNEKRGVFVKQLYCLMITFSLPSI